MKNVRKDLVFSISDKKLCCLKKKWYSHLGRMDNSRVPLSACNYQPHDGRRDVGQSVAGGGKREAETGEFS